MSNGALLNLDYTTAKAHNRTMKEATVVFDVTLWPDDVDPARDIFLQAARFELAAMLLKDQLTIHRKFHFMPPFVTNAAFALELYMKCMIVMQGGEVPAEHDLEYLFSNISRVTKAKLRKRFNTISIEQKIFEKPDLDSLLKMSKDAFVFLRYAYEEDSGDKGTGFGLWPLLVCIREFIFEAKPEWKTLPLCFKKQRIQ